MDWALWAGVVSASTLAGIAILWIVGGYYHLRYYVRRRHEPETWKLQPKRMPSAKQQKKAMLLSTANLTVAGFCTGNFVYFLMNDGLQTPIYYDVADYGWAWSIGGTLVLFALVDAAAYYVHRFLHTPFMYRRFHKTHHRWGSPTPWVVIAVHPVEMALLQLATFVPFLLIPFHYVSVIVVFIYVFVFNIIDHSGVRLRSIWPWQGPSQYHDDHHVLFHVNFGQHLMFWDRIHGTLRRQNREYGVEAFGGKGTPSDDDRSPADFFPY